MTRDLARPGVMDTALAEPLALVYKHSPICPVSTRAAREIERFEREHPEVPVYRVDVVGDRAVSQAIAARLGVRHESPQAILLREGTPVWHESHGGVTATAVAGAAAAAAGQALA
jgi:bacillithiol system protein YtxJ